MADETEEEKAAKRKSESNSFIREMLSWGVWGVVLAGIAYGLGRMFGMIPEDSELAKTIDEMWQKFKSAIGWGEADKIPDAELKAMLTGTLALPPEMADAMVKNKKAFIAVFESNGVDPEALLKPERFQAEVLGSPTILKALLTDARTATPLLKLAGLGEGMHQQLKEAITAGELKLDTLANTLKTTPSAQFKQVLTSHVIQSLTEERMIKIMASPDMENVVRETVRATLEKDRAGLVDAMAKLAPTLSAEQRNEAVTQTFERSANFVATNRTDLASIIGVGKFKALLSPTAEGNPKALTDISSLLSDPAVLDRLKAGSPALAALKNLDMKPLQDPAAIAYGELAKVALTGTRENGAGTNLEVVKELVTNNPDGFKALLGSLQAGLGASPDAKTALGTVKLSPEMAIKVKQAITAMDFDTAEVRKALIPALGTTLGTIVSAIPESAITSTQRGSEGLIDTMIKSYVEPEIDKLLPPAPTPAAPARGVRGSAAQQQ